jgi:hypothetical protein
MCLTLEEVMEGIYAVGENCSLYIGSDWDGGWRVRIGGGWHHSHFLEEKDAHDLREAAEWLHEQALIHFPGYAQRFGVKVKLGGPPGAGPP